MGNSCCGKITHKERLALLLVGLDNAGKTLTAKNLAGETVDSTVPTIGFSVINLTYMNYNVRIYDLGGSVDIRGIWYKYFVDVHGVIFVIDSSDSDRFHEVKNTLEEMLNNQKIMGKPLLILANKQDQENALDEIDIIECLQIEHLANTYKCPTLVQCCSATDNNSNKLDHGIKLGFEWLIKHIDCNYNKINARVEMDRIEQEINEKEQMIAKLKRIYAERELRKANQVQDPNAIQTYSEYISSLNQENNQQISNLEDSYPNSSTSANRNSVIVNTHLEPKQQQRPKSAVQLVKRQLELKTELKRSLSANPKKEIRRNKTAAVNLFEGRQFGPGLLDEAKMIRNNNSNSSNNVKKLTGKKIFIIGNNKVGPGGDYYHDNGNDRSEAFSLKEKSSNNNGICVMEIE